MVDFVSSMEVKVKSGAIAMRVEVETNGQWATKRKWQRRRAVLVRDEDIRRIMLLPNERLILEPISEKITIMDKDQNVAREVFVPLTSRGRLDEEEIEIPDVS